MRDIRKLVLLSAFGMATLFSLVGCGQDRTPTEYVARANEFLAKGDFQAASIELSNALQKDPRTVEARWLMARIALWQGDGARAEKEIRRAMELGHPQEAAQPTLVKAILLQGDLDRVLAETLKLPPASAPEDKALLLSLRGQALVLQAKYDQAKPILDQALELNPKSAPAMVGMAVLEASQRKQDEARRWAGLALEADGASPEAWSVLGELELTQGKAAEAETAFTNAIKQRSYPTMDRAKRALARSQLEKFQDAEADILTLRQQGWKDHPYVNYVAGLIRFRQQMYREAATAFEASYAAEPDFLPNRMYLATTKLLLGETEQALTHANFLHANAPRSPTANRLLGAIHISRAEYADARNLLQTALRTSPENGTTLRMLATLSLLEGDTAKGLEYSRKVASLEPQSREAQNLFMMAKLITGEALGPAGQANSEDEFTREFLLALEAFRNKKVGEAFEQAKKLHEQHPGKVAPLNLIAACYLAAGHWDAAKVELAKVLEIKPNEPSATRNLARVEIRGGNLQRARALLQALIKEQPGDEDAALLLAETEARGGDLPSAISVLEQVVRHNPNALDARAKLAGEHLRTDKAAKVLEVTQDLSIAQLQKQPALLELRAKAQMLSGDLASARMTFEKWTKTVPGSAEAHFYYSDSLARSGEAARARMVLERAVQLDPKYLPARIGQIKMLVQAGELEKARRALVKLRSDFDERDEVLGIEGWFALGTGNYVTAEQRLSVAHKQRPSTELTILLTRALWAQKKHEEGLKVMKTWLEDHPRDVEILLHLAGGYLSLGRNDEAITTYAKVIEVSSDHIPALNNLAWLNRDKHPEKAMDYAQRAYLLGPADPYVLDTLGMLTLKSGNILRAHELIKSASERAPKAPEIQVHLGQVLIQMNQPTQAKRVLEAVVKNGAEAKNRPETQPAREARALLDTIDANKR